MNLMNPFTLENYALSDIGHVRQNNEDAFVEMPLLPCFILADGMGGHQAGEVASHETVSHLSSSIKSFLLRFDRFTLDELIFLLTQAIKKANDHVHGLSLKEEKLRGMGTTVCLAFLHKEILITAHVGDSRIYRIRNKKIERLTLDHSLRDELMAKGQKYHVSKNVITRAIGTNPSVIPELHTTPVISGDIYFLCSDGLTDSLSDGDLLSIILSASTIKGAVELLIKKANLYGGNDNITVVMFKVQ